MMILAVVILAVAAAVAVVVAVVVVVFFDCPRYYFRSHQFPRHNNKRHNVRPTQNLSITSRHQGSQERRDWGVCVWGGGGKDKRIR